MSSSIYPNWRVISVALLIQKGKVLLGLRHSQKNEGENLWEFPGGSVEVGEHPQTTMIRELKEELNIQVVESEIADCLCDYRKEAFRLIVFFYVTAWEGEIKKTCHHELNWFSPEECMQKRIPNINPKLFKNIINMITKKTDS